MKPVQMRDSGGKTLAFAGFSLEPRRRRLTGPDGAEIPLQPRVFDLLMLFLARPGELLAKTEIMAAIWPDTTVEENNLNQAVSALRRTLGDSTAQPRLIATVPKRGYQFIAPVEPVENTPRFALPRRAARIATGIAAGAALAAAAGLALWTALPGGPAPAPAIDETLAGRAETASEAAYDHYLLGNAYLAQSGVPMLHAAVEQFRKAVDIDPGYGAAWAAMARAADGLEVEEPQFADQHHAMQREAVARAAETAPDEWETTAVRARLLMRERRWEDAARILQEANAKGAPSPVEAAEIEGVFLMHTGRPSEALALFRAGRRADPLSFTMSARLAWAMELTGNREGALAEYAHAQTLPGDETAWAFQHLVRLLESGDRRAVESYLRNYPYSEDGTAAVMHQLSEVWRSPSDALAVLWVAHDSGQVRGPHRLDALALLAAHYGYNELALQMLREEFFARNGGSTAHLWNPAMRTLRRTEGFKTLVRDLGFAQYWRETGDWPDFCQPVDESDFTCR